MKRLHGTRRYHEENMRDVFQSDEGKALYTAFCEANTLTKNTAIVNSTLGVDGGTNPLGLNAVGTQYNYHISQKLLVHVRNISTHPIFVSCYTIAPKGTRGLASEGSMRELCIQELFDGWQADMAAGNTSTTTKEGDYAVVQNGSVQIDSYAMHLKMRYSRQFNQNWKIIQSKSLKLNPGDDIYWNIKVPKGIFNPNKLNSAGDPQEMNSRSRMFLLKQCGVIGESAGTDGNVAAMQSELAVGCTMDASVVPMNQYGSQLALDVNHDILQTDYVGPGEHTLEVDAV